MVDWLFDPHTWLWDWSRHNHQGQETEPGEAREKKRSRREPQKGGNLNFSTHTVDGRNPALVDRLFNPLL